MLLGPLFFGFCALLDDVLRDGHDGVDQPDALHDAEVPRHDRRVNQEHIEQRVRASRQLRGLTLLQLCAGEPVELRAARRDEADLLRGERLERPHLQRQIAAHDLGGRDLVEQAEAGEVEAVGRGHDCTAESVTLCALPASICGTGRPLWPSYHAATDPHVLSSAYATRRYLPPTENCAVRHQSTSSTMAVSPRPVTRSELNSTLLQSIRPLRTTSCTGRTLDLRLAERTLL